MKITRKDNLWQPWQENLASFALAWWLYLMPSVTRALWPVAMSGKMPELLDGALRMAPLWLIGGSIVALITMSNDFRKFTRAQRISLWFLLGVATLLFSIPLMP